MNRLSRENKEKLIKNAKAVYFGYLKLEWLNKKEFLINGKKRTIANFIRERKDEIEGATIILDNGKKPIELRMSLQNGQLTFTDRRSNAINPETTIKDLTKYKDKDIATLLTGSNFGLNTAGELAFSTTITDSNKQESRIGGTGKISLYSLHISNLGRIIQHLSSSKSDYNMLVSLTTGSGKTFTQALWMMVLQMAGVNGIFGVPSHLLKQFKEDLRRLIPDNMVAEILLEPAGEANKIVIDSTQNLLLTRHEELESKDPNSTLFSFDEAHLLAIQENLFVKAQKLASKFVNLYLTATPTPALADLAKGDNKKQQLITVAAMNNEQKVKNGYAERTSSYSESAKSIAEMGKKARLSLRDSMGRALADSIDPQIGYDAANAFGEAYLYNLTSKPFFGSAKAIQKNKKLKTLPALSPEDQLRLAVRWSLQPSAFNGKTLVCTNHFADIVNLDLFLTQLKQADMSNLLSASREEAVHKRKTPSAQQKTEQIPSLSASYYALNDRFSRDEAYGILLISETVGDKTSHVDTTIYEKYARVLHEQYQGKLQAEINQLGINLAIQFNSPENLMSSAAKLAEEMIIGLPHAPITNSMHQIVDLTISILAAAATGKEPNLANLMQDFGGAFLDNQRFNNLSKFSRNVIGVRLNVHDREWLTNLLTYNNESNPKGLEPQIASDLAEIISNIMFSLYHLNEADQKRFIDNWYADQVIFKKLPSQLTKKLYSFAEKNYKQFVFSKVESNETIPPEVDFNEFEEQVHMVGIAKLGEADEHADYVPKQGAKRPVKALNYRATESLFVPKEKAPLASSSNKSLKEITKEKLEMTDNLFRLGIATIYATDKKIEGFNDPNLHQVAVFAPSTENNLANPANVIQAYGRNRGLNSFKVPNFFLIAQKGVRCLFGVNELNKADYQADYYQSLKNFKAYYIKNLGQDLGAEILAWIEKNRNEIHQVNEEELSEAVVNMCFEKLDLLNKANAFKFKLTQEDFAIVLDGAISHISKKQKALEYGTQLPFGIRVLACLMHLLARFVHWLAAKNPQAELKKLAKEAKAAVDCAVSQGMDDEPSRIAILHHTITSIDLEEIWKHDLSRKIIMMNVLNEASALDKNHDKYYSVVFLKPLNVLTDHSKKQIKTNYPQLQILIEGMASYMALSTLEDKRALLGRLADAIATNNQGAIIKIISADIKNLQLNENHPERKLHVPRVKKMLTALGYSAEEISTHGIAGVIQNDNTLETRTTQLISENSMGLQYLETNGKAAGNYLDYIKQYLVNDVKELVSPFISSSSHKEMLNFILTQFTGFSSSSNFETFLKNPRNYADLITILHDYREDPSSSKEILTYIHDVFTIGDTAAFYEKYFLPSEEVLNSGNFDISLAPIFKIATQIELIFSRINESNLRFYRVTSQGKAKDLNGQDRQFFRASTQDRKSIVRRAVDGYDIRLLNAHKKEAVAVPQTIYVLFGPLGIAGIKQITANGEENVLAHYDKLPEIYEWYEGITQRLMAEGKLDKRNLHNLSIVSELTPQELNILNGIILSLEVAPEAPLTQPHKKRPASRKSESIFSPSVSDQYTHSGQLWRNIFSLNTLKKTLPTLNQVNKAVRGKEIEKAVETSKKVLGNIKNLRTINSADTLTMHASLFSQVLKKEINQKKSAQEACEEALKQSIEGASEEKYPSRVDKMHAAYNEKKKAYYSQKISEQTASLIFRKMLCYLISRADFKIQETAEIEDGFKLLKIKEKLLRPNSSQPDNEQSFLFKVKTRNSMFNNNLLTAKKIALVEKFIRKMQSAKLDNNYHKMLVLIEKIITENQELMMKHGKKPSSGNDLQESLELIRQILITATPIPDVNANEVEEIDPKLELYGSNQYS